MGMDGIRVGWDIEHLTVLINQKGQSGQKMLKKLIKGVFLKLPGFFDNIIVIDEQTCLHYEENIDCD